MDKWQQDNWSYTAQILQRKDHKDYQTPIFLSVDITVVTAGGGACSALFGVLAAASESITVAVLAIVVLVGADSKGIWITGGDVDAEGDLISVAVAVDVTGDLISVAVAVDLTGDAADIDSEASLVCGKGWLIDAAWTALLSSPASRKQYTGPR